MRFHLFAQKLNIVILFSMNFWKHSWISDMRITCTYLLTYYLYEDFPARLNPCWQGRCEEIVTWNLCRLSKMLKVERIIDFLARAFFIVTISFIFVSWQWLSALKFQYLGFLHLYSIVKKKKKKVGLTVFKFGVCKKKKVILDERSQWVMQKFVLRFADSQ